MSITLARASGNLPGPWYTVVVHGNGLVEYDGKNQVPVLGHRTATIPQDKILALLQEVDGMKFMSAKERDFSAVDAASVTVVVSVDGMTARISSVPMDGFSYPSEQAIQKMNPLARTQLNFIKLAEDISNFAGAGQWTKCSAACMMYLFHNGNPKNSVDANGESALLYAIERKEPEVLGGVTITPQALIETGADVNLANSRGTTPLMAAAKKGDADLVRDLLARDADRAARDKKGRTALDVAQNAEVRAMLSRNDGK